MAISINQGTHEGVTVFVVRDQQGDDVAVYYPVEGSNRYEVWDINMETRIDVQTSTGEVSRVLVRPEDFVDAATSMLLSGVLSVEAN